MITRSNVFLYWPVIIAVAIPVYCISHYVLLRSVSNNISFVKQELAGLEEYKKAFALSVDISNPAKGIQVAEQIIYNSKSSHYTAWKEAASKIKKSTAEKDLRSILKEAIRDIGDESNLILDPVLESYYAAYILIHEMPLIAEAISQDGVPKELLINSENKLDHALESLSTKEETQSLVREVNALKLLMHQISGERKLELLSRLEVITANTNSILAGMLNERLRQQENLRYLTIVVVICIYFAVVTLVILSVRYYLHKREFAATRERQRLLIKIANKNNELEQFVYAAAHDLKEPVRTMSCFAALLREEGAGKLSEAITDYTRIIENTARRAEHMINDLLHYTQTTEEVIYIEECDCNKELQAVFEDLKKQIEETAPNITHTDLPVLKTAPQMFRRVLLNLIDNAIKYRKPNTPISIHIRAQQQEDKWLFAVSDNGIGIAEEAREVIFEPFKRLHPDINKGGIGIGLTSAKKIIERLNGEIWVSSILGQGTTIYFSLPA